MSPSSIDTTSDLRKSPVFFWLLLASSGVSETLWHAATIGKLWKPSDASLLVCLTSSQAATMILSQVAKQAHVSNCLTTIPIVRFHCNDFCKLPKPQLDCETDKQAKTAHSSAGQPAAKTRAHLCRVDRFGTTLDAQVNVGAGVGLMGALGNGLLHCRCRSCSFVARARKV